MKAVLLFAIAIAITVGMAIYTTHYQKAHTPKVEVLGMCIPKSHVAEVMNSGLTILLLSRSDFDPISGPWVDVYFTPREMMRAIPGWTNYRGDGESHDKLQVALEVPISEDVPWNHKGIISNATPEMYELTGPYKQAKVSELGHSGLFKVVEGGKPGPNDSWELLFIDPRDKNKPPVEALHLWWDAGTCFYASPTRHITTFCFLHYVNQRLIFRATLKGKNILLTRQVDAFLSRKVHEWRAACHTKT
ncbi:MAG: hypothetical protein ACRD22_09380 [Terriglobia bacterium]